MARPIKLNKEIIKKIVDAIKAGNYLETASAYAGVSKVTLYNWLKRGARAKRNSIYKEFLNAVEKAQAEAEVRDVLIIAKAAEKNWQASAWRLERKYPQRWGRREAINLEGELSVENKVKLDPKLERIAMEIYRKYILSEEQSGGVLPDSGEGTVESEETSSLDKPEVNGIRAGRD